MVRRIPESLGYRKLLDLLRRRRVELKLTQAGVSRRLGCKDAYIHHIETDTNEVYPSAPHLLNWIETLGLEVKLVDKATQVPYGDNNAPVSS